MSNTTRRPTVGDFVRVINTDSFTDAAELKMGDVVKIRQDDKSDRPYRLHSNPGRPSDVYCFASCFELVTNLHPKLEALKATHAKMAEEIKALETKIAEEAKAKRPELAAGQLWHKTSGKAQGLYITHRHGHPGATQYSLVALDNHRAGDAWGQGCGFKSDASDFTYIGMASDILTIKEPNK